MWYMYLLNICDLSGLISLILCVYASYSVIYVFISSVCIGKSVIVLLQFMHVCIKMWFLTTKYQILLANSVAFPLYVSPNCCYFHNFAIFLLAFCQFFHNF